MVTKNIEEFVDEIVHVNEEIRESWMQGYEKGYQW